MLKRIFIGLISVLFALGCGGDTSDDGNAENNRANNGNGKGDQISGETVCVGIRGNGELITAHFGALARIAEHYGPIDGVSGGSSGSISAFMLSSIQSNPLILDCNGESCSLLETRNREALMLKSFQGYVEFLTQTDEALAVQSAIPIVQQVQAEGISGLAAEDAETAIEALTTILESDRIAPLVNPELLQLLAASPNPQYHIQDISAAIQGFGSFGADDPKILVRPGLLNFEALADQLSIAASFYAGYGEYDADGVEAWLNACAEPSRGMQWSELRDLPFNETTSCGDAFYGMLGQYRAAFEANPDAPSRGDDMIGTYMPALISTSVLTGDAVTAWEGARAQYMGGEDPELDINFDDVRFGYFGDSDSLATLENSTLAREDAKSQKALSLGTVTWKQAISLSPAEPGLARALEIREGQVSAGGWSDLHPVLVLEDMGCENVIYVTREDPESGFARGVAGLLGMTADDDNALYSLDNPDSSFSQSIAAAAGVWCTDWNNIEALNIEAVITDAYNAPMHTSSDYLSGSGAYENLTDASGVTGCSQ